MSKDRVTIVLKGVDITFSVSADADERVIEIVEAVFPGAKTQTQIAPEVTQVVEDHIFDTEKIKGKRWSGLPKERLLKAYNERPQVFTERDRNFLQKAKEGV